MVGMASTSWSCMTKLTPSLVRARNWSLPCLILTWVVVMEVQEGKNEVMEVQEEVQEGVRVTEEVTKVTPHRAQLRPGRYPEPLQLEVPDRPGDQGGHHGH